jgi:hypothetical protein
MPPNAQVNFNESRIFFLKKFLPLIHDECIPPRVSRAIPLS